MKNYLYAALLVVSCSVLASCGSSTSTPGRPQTDDPQNAVTAPRETLFETTADATVNDTHIGEGSTVSIIEESTDGSMVRVGIENSDDDNSLDLWVSQESLQSLNLAAIDDVDPYDADGNQVLFERKAMTYCYKYVKLYLLNHGLVKSYLPGASAYMAYSILPKYGFHLVSRKPAQAIVNDVCVYGGGNGGNGHIEIKTSQGWYYGYGYKAKPIANHPLKGCFHK